MKRGGRRLGSMAAGFETRVERRVGGVAWTEPSTEWQLGRVAWTDERGSEASE